MTRLLKGAGALSALLVMVAAPPMLLSHFIGNPWPAEGISASAPLTDDAIIGILATVVWVLWAQFVWCVIAEAVAIATADRRSPSTRLTFSPQRHLARRLLSVLVLATMAAPIVAAAVPAYAALGSESLPSGSQPMTNRMDTATPRVARHESPRQIVARTDAALQATTVVTVMRLDSLWSIAERELGDGERWGEIAALNEDHTMTDGTVFASADHVLAGWRLRVPTARQGADDEATGRLVKVEPGDTLSSIAEREIGDPAEFPQIFSASRTIEQPGGRHLSDPDIIDVGWVLRVPGPEEQDPEAATSVPDAAPTEDSQRPPVESPVPTTSPLQSDPGPARVAPSPDVSVDNTLDNDSEDTHGPPWMLVALAGAGAMLGGALHLELRARRRSQSRARVPGKSVGAIDPALIGIEKSIWVHEEAAATTSDLNLALRRLGGWSANGRVPMPQLAAVELARGFLTLHLSSPSTEMPDGWQDAAGSGVRWTTSLDPNRSEEIDLGGIDAPYPLLVTVGQATSGETWLLNLEELGDIRLLGEPSHRMDFTRYILAELALNPWSAQARVSCIGLSDDVAVLSSDRINVCPLADGASVIESVRSYAMNTSDRSQRVSGDPATGRTGQLDDDLWQSRALVVAHGVDLGELRKVLQTSSGKTATSIVELAVADDDHPGAGIVELLLTADGGLAVPAFDLHVRAVQLTQGEALGCAALLAEAGASGGTSIPGDESDPDGLAALIDRAGAVRTEFVASRSAIDDQPDLTVMSLLPLTDEAYLKSAPVTRADLESLAPVVPHEVATQVEGLDPDLDRDVNDWFDEGCFRPRLSLLGPVTVKAYGAALAKRKPYFTEMLTYLALRRRHGVTPSDLAEAFNIEVRKARIYINTIRDWLGCDPVSDDPYLPHADKAPATQLTGVPVYQLSDRLLIDTELFTRLRARGQARGETGIVDLRRALGLVRGAPFSTLRPGGWAWLLDGERHDQYATYAVADVALIVTTSAIAAHDVETALFASERGLDAAPDEEGVQLARVRALEAAGRGAEARERFRSEIADWTESDTAPKGPSTRTKSIRVGWRSAG